MFSAPTGADQAVQAHSQQQTGEIKRQGRFYSRVYRFIGTWRIDQNCLTLVWDGDNRVDVVGFSSPGG